MSEEPTKKARRSKARKPEIILAGLQEIAMMLLRDAHNPGICERLGELLDELSRALSGRTESEEA